MKKLSNNNGIVNGSMQIMKYKDGPVRKYHNNLPKIQMITKQAAAWKLSTDYSTRYKKKSINNAAKEEL